MITADSRFDLSTVRAHLGAGGSVKALLDEVKRRDAAWGDPALWITRAPDSLEAAFVEALPKGGALLGVPFAVKDNIDVAGLPTTAACPDFEYNPAESSMVVKRLVAAGAIPVGKTNLDQFATGLVGVRSPYGIPVNPFDAETIPGGSSSGSATAVSAGLVPFSLGTDTAGSGRVPAALNGLVGLKPTKGLVSTRGVVPACRSLDCVSVFAHNVSDVATVLSVAAGHDEQDPFSRVVPQGLPHLARAKPVIGVPSVAQREFFGWTRGGELFEGAIARWKSLGADVVEIDYAPFLAAAKLLYEGPWVAERLAAIDLFLQKDGVTLHPITRAIIEGARGQTASTAFRAFYRLEALKRESQAVWKGLDAMMTPTLPFAPKVSDVLADPIRINSQLGTYTNHFNLFDLCGVAVPWGIAHGKVPWGVTLSAPAFHDDLVLDLAARFVGEATPPPAVQSAGAQVRLAVCGAHLSGLPLNRQLVTAGARLVSATVTAPTYRLYALPNTVPPKPGLVRVAEGGASVAVEVWELDQSAYGAFVAAIPSPLGIGTIELIDGTSVQGFLCEPIATVGALDVTSFGGWRAYLKSR